jgi:hypothetical protein
MEDVKLTLNEHMETWKSEGEHGEFTELAKRWASHSLETYTGILLDCALEISRALAEFDAELLQKNADRNA